MHIDAIVGIAPIRRAASRRDDPRVAETSEVVGHKVLRLTDQLCEFADLPVASSQLLKQTPALLVSQELNEPKWRYGCCQLHFRRIHQFALLCQDSLMHIMSGTDLLDLTLKMLDRPFA